MSTGRKFKRTLTLNEQEILKFLQNTLGHEWMYDKSYDSGLTGKCVIEFDGRNVFKVQKTEDTFTATRARGGGAPEGAPPRPRELVVKEFEGIFGVKHKWLEHWIQDTTARCSSPHRDKYEIHVSLRGRVIIGRSVQEGMTRERRKRGDGDERGEEGEVRKKEGEKVGGKDKGEGREAEEGEEEEGECLCWEFDGPNVFKV
ncbi:hypothetical protein DAPPUDRAFT_104873 [Daphnia pulex]|uniref:Uncharacterized protein n=1 Tax=Daphnia pulex TaxID=6669 RepID=E9GNL9_DAPPU|nr:hypothetical protein DAPPUDRAFT_104873 [Daphnia pulex]|eukprot:EFX78792.1 hypothetical protein DAPPUDRAFT_104873 [Daphnia pulex]